MQFKVPQFLDIEDKIFGPFTFKEFIYIVGGGGLCFFFYKWLGLLYGAIPIMVIALLAGLLTFYKPNNKPFINLVEASFKYFIQSKLYIWQRRNEKKLTEEEKQKAILQRLSNNKNLDSDKLRDLAWSLDVLDSKKEK
ncbi:PrgI family protein [Candidatus Nomurabacteria bacterium]|nr:PrgI family protein [Candidatus Nomurabacteria bacterium]